MALQTLLLTAILGLLLYAVYRIYRFTDYRSENLTSTLKESILDSGLSSELGEIRTHASEIKELHGDIASMLRAPQQRGCFGEEQLETILSDHLPADMYGIRKKAVGGKVPDAYIDTSQGKVCIDSKFPLDNYENFVETGDESYAKKFGRDVRKQLEKIERDYIDRDNGTVGTAFAFIPSESVYYHLVTEEFDMIREFSSRGVQLVSPLTLGHKLQLIKADIRSRKMSEKAEEIEKRLESVSKGFESLEKTWSTLRKHIRNSGSKAEEMNSEFENLKDRFDRINGLDG